MAIGTTAAILGSAVIGAVGSSVAGSKNSKAISQSTTAQTESNANSLALQERVYNQNRDTLNPYVQRGNAAGNQINALLGLGGSQQQSGRGFVGALPGYGQPNALSQFQGYPGGAGAPYGLGDTPGYAYDGQPGRAEALASNDYGSPQNNRGYANINTPLPDSYYASGFGGGFNGGNLPSATYGPPAQGQTAQGAAEDAFASFRNGTGYQFRLGEGLDAVGSSYAGIGGLQSGAALRGIAEYGQNFASNEFGNYAGLLSGQQGTGLQAAGAQAGVGVNYANAAAGINQNNANALSSAAVARANNSNATIGGIGNAFGNVLGGLAYRPSQGLLPSGGLIPTTGGGFSAVLR